MGQIFTLDAGTIQIMEYAINDIILYLGKQCKIVYPPKTVPCGNCLRDASGKSRNIYLHGGPVPFPSNSICPLCGGSGSSKEEEVTEIVQVIINWNPKEWMNIKLDQTRLANGVLHVKGHIGDMPKFMRMSYMVPDIKIAAYADYRFQLKGEPWSGGNIVQGKFFECLLDRSPS